MHLDGTSGIIVSAEDHCPWLVLEVRPVGDIMDFRDGTEINERVGRDAGIVPHVAIHETRRIDYLDGLKIRDATREK